MSFAPTDAEIAQGRVDLGELPWERCTIRRPSAPTQPFADLYLDVPCRLSAEGFDVLGEMILSASDPHGNITLTLPAGTDMRAGDQALVSNRLLVGWRRFEA